MTSDIELEKCMARWNEEFARERREDEARERADARLRRRAAR